MDRWMRNDGWMRDRCVARCGLAGDDGWALLLRVQAPSKHCSKYIRLSTVVGNRYTGGDCTLDWEMRDAWAWLWCGHMAGAWPGVFVMS